MWLARDRVVVRNAPALMVLTAVVVGPLTAGIWWGVIAAIAHRDWHYSLPNSEDWSAAAMTLAWAVVLIILVLCTGTLLIVFSMRMVYLPDRVVVRRFWGSHTILLSDVSSITTAYPGVRTGVSVVRFPRLVIAGPVSGAGGVGPVNALLDGTLMNAAKAFDVLDGWVRLRPEIAGDDETREHFRARGALV